MSTVASKLIEVVASIKALPDDAQAALVTELEQRVAEFIEPQMTESQRAEVERRLALPREYVAEEDVRAILRRYNASL